MIVKDIIRAIKIEEAMKEYTELTPKGENYIAKCPFCGNEATMIVSPKHKTYKCFKCGKYGNIVTLVMEKMGMTPNQAMRYLKKKYLVS